jgi:hypothetical protein
LWADVVAGTSVVQELFAVAQLFTGKLVRLVAPSLLMVTLVVLYVMMVVTRGGCAALVVHVE